MNGDGSPQGYAHGDSGAGSAKLWGVIGALNGAIAVAAGAFGAHAVGDAHAVELLETGSRWQAVSALAAVAAVLLGARVAAGLHAVGAALFALSIYALAFGAPTPVAFVTPVGGVGMLAGWVMLALALLKMRPKQQA